jgi:hypothetical protein
MPIYIAGLPASVSYSPEVLPSRVSVRFASVARYQTRRHPGPLLPLSVTAATSDGCFTGVLSFMTDSLCEQDVVLGRDWDKMCELNNVRLSESVAEYYGGELARLSRGDVKLF